MLRILIVDDHMIIRSGLIRILRENARIGAIGEAADGPAALQQIRTATYDVILLDIALGDRDGMDLLATLRHEMPRVGIVMLSVYPETQFAVRAIRSGANAYLNKSCHPDDLFSAIFKAADGSTYITPVIADLLARCVRQDVVRAPHEELSNREFQVLKLLAAGRSVGEIAQQLSLSSNTIFTYRVRIYEKLGVRSIVELVSYTTRHQLAPLGEAL